VRGCIVLAVVEVMSIAADPKITTDGLGISDVAGEGVRAGR
jgi:hypothetical protein